MLFEERELLLGKRLITDVMVHQGKGLEEPLIFFLDSRGVIHPVEIL